MLKQQHLNIFDADEEELIASTYTKKVTIPVYVPKYEKPMLHDLYDKTKAEALYSEIAKSGLSVDEKQFLMTAAYRHVSFNFGKIADFYAQSCPEMQSLMEQSALVIVDYGKAIEYGFVALNADLANTYLEDQND